MQGGKQIFLLWALYFMEDTGNNPEWLIDLPSKNTEKLFFYEKKRGYSLRNLQSHARIVIISLPFFEKGVLPYLTKLFCINEWKGRPI
jgi:hypothetical protein